MNPSLVRRSRCLAAALVTTVVACSPTGNAPVGMETGGTTGGAGTPYGTGGSASGTGGDPGSGVSSTTLPGAGGAGGAATGTGGAPVQVAPGMPGTAYDPSVQFDWPEATQVGSCKAGHYHGSFIGIYSPAIAVAPVPIPVAGDIDITLGESADGEFFEVSGGKISGVADGLFPFSGDVQGTLDCATGKLIKGFLSKCSYIVGVIPYAFEGPLVADYDKQTHAFTNGTWEVGEPTWTTPKPAYGGSGTWNATLVP